jgi:hypothetical protein
LLTASQLKRSEEVIRRYFFFFGFFFSFFMPMPLATVLTSLRRVARPSGGASARVGLGQL